MLSDFLHSFRLEQLQPDHSAIGSSPGLIPHVLSDGEGTFAIFLRAVGTTNTNLEIRTGPGNYQVQAVDPITGKYTELGTLASDHGKLDLRIEIEAGELALKIIRV